jgi:hypothetical protein
MKKIRIRRRIPEDKEADDFKPVKNSEMNKSFSSEDIHRLIDNVLTPKMPDKPVTVSSSEEIVPKIVDAATINYVEKMPTWNWNRALMYLTVLGIMGIIFFTMYLQASPAFLLLTWLFGTLCFLPLGLVLGWLFLNPDVRVLIMRRMRGKNYGLVHFVHKGGQRIITRIKNFDDDVIIQDTKMWILRSEGIYYLDKSRNLVSHAHIESNNIKTMPANIPALFLDSDTMIPLTFHSVQSQSNPQQVGATILGYIYNQLAKALFLKKGLQIFFIIIIILTAVNLVLGLQNAM